MKKGKTEEAKRGRRVDALCKSSDDYKSNSRGTDRGVCGYV